MTTVIKIKLDQLDQYFIRNLQEKYGMSELEIRVIGQNAPEMNFADEDFWKLIGLLDWTDEENDGRIVEPVVKALTQGPLAHIYRFADILSEKLWQLDTRRHAQVFLDNPEEEGYLSVDDFLYARCAVVANGKAFYEQVLQQPEDMPDDLTFEPLLSVALLAYQRQTGQMMMAPPAYNYETYSNKSGWE